MPAPKGIMWIYGGLGREIDRDDGSPGKIRDYGGPSDECVISLL